MSRRHSQSSPLNQLSSTPAPGESRRAFARRVLGALSLTRVATLGGFGALVTGAGCSGDTSYDVSYEPYWTYRAQRLEDYQIANFEAYRTKASPNGHKVEVHDPAVSVANNVVTAKVDHVMEIDHWITTVYLRDMDSSRVFYLKEFLPLEKDEGAEKGVTITADLPQDVNSFAAFAYCNKHELWMSDIIQF